MENAYIPQLKILRQHIPIGIKHALQLLKKTQGDINASISLYKEDAVRKICTEAACSPEIAERYLQQHNYDVAFTLQQLSFDQEKTHPVAKDKIPAKMMNLLMNGKAKNTGPNMGKVAAKVKPTGKNADNPAWISILSHHGSDCRNGYSIDYFLNFEVEYLELNEHYEDRWYMDLDQYLVKRETYYNIKTETELEILLHTWLSDLSSLTHIQLTDHPDY